MPEISVEVQQGKDPQNGCVLGQGATYLSDQKADCLVSRTEILDTLREHDTTEPQLYLVDILGNYFSNLLRNTPEGTRTTTQSRVLLSLEYCLLFNLNDAEN